MHQVLIAEFRKHADGLRPLYQNYFSSASLKGATLNVSILIASSLSHFLISGCVKRTPTDLFSKSRLKNFFKESEIIR